MKTGLFFSQARGENSCFVVDEAFFFFKVTNNRHRTLSAILVFIAAPEIWRNFM